MQNGLYVNSLQKALKNNQGYAFDKVLHVKLSFIILRLFAYKTL